MRRTALLSFAVFAVFALVLVPAPAGADASAENVTLYHTPEADLDGAAAVESSIESGPAHSAESMLRNETLIVAIESERLAADLDERSGSTSERFFAALEGDAELGAKEARMTPESPANELSITRENVTVYRSGNRTYLLIEPENLRITDDDGDGWRVSPGDVLRFAFGYGVDDSVGQWATVVPHDELGHFDDVPETLPAARTEISPAIHVEPRRFAEVRLHLATGETRTERLETGSLSRASFDLSDVPDGTSYRLELVHDGEILETRTGRVTELDATVENVRLVERGDERVLNATATLSHGGRVFVRDDHGDYHAGESLGPGVPTDVTLRLDDLDEFDDALTVHAERADVRDAYYPGHDPVATVDLADGTVEMHAPNESADGEPAEGVDGSPEGDSAGENGTTDAETDASSSDEPDGRATSSGDSLPGFGVPTALTALATLLVARRR